MPPGCHMLEDQRFRSRPVLTAERPHRQGFDAPSPHLLLVKLEDKPLVARQKRLRSRHVRHRDRARYRQRQHWQLPALHVQRQAIERVERPGWKVLQRNRRSLLDRVTWRDHRGVARLDRPGQERQQQQQQQQTTHRSTTLATWSMISVGKCRRKQSANCCVAVATVGVDLLIGMHLHICILYNS